MAAMVDPTETDDVMTSADLLSQRSEIFRSKLITDFHLLETVAECGTKRETPLYYSDDLLDKLKLKSMMQKQPNGLVRFQIFVDHDLNVTRADRRRNRVKNKSSKNPPLDMWAHWIVHSPWFGNSILALILINSVVLGIEGELADTSDPQIEILSQVLEIFDNCTMWVFVVEICLKWIDDFWGFWKNRWNIFDFFITFLFFIPEIINFATGDFKKKDSHSDLAVITSNLRTFRVLRSLKMVSRFQKVRLIVMAVTKAFQAMVFITVLLFIFAYIFAIIGVMFLKEGYKANADKLHYSDSFSNMSSALITLTQLFTLDHWLDVYSDVTSIGVGYSFLTGFYIIFWIVIGSFIFKNIFVGIMVNNFQSIRNELFQEVEQIKDREERDIQMAEFAEELDRQNMARKIGGPEAGRRVSVMVDTHKGRSASIAIQHARDQQSSSLGGKSALPRLSIMQDVIKEDNRGHLSQAGKESLEWQTKVERNLGNLSKEEAFFCWPRDSLFRYLLMMEALQENLKEREELFNLANQALLNMHNN